MKLRPFRRPAAAAPAVDDVQDRGDALALAIANRRILALETQTATLQHRLNRYADGCAAPCRHAMQLEVAQFEVIRLAAERDDVIDRTRLLLSTLREMTLDRIQPARAGKKAA